MPLTFCSSASPGLVVLSSAFGGILRLELLLLGAQRLGLGIVGGLIGEVVQLFGAILIHGAAALLTAACNRNNADQVNNAEMNQYGAEQLNDLANEAANNAEAEALGTQQQQLEAQNAANADDNTTNPGDADEQNVSGM